MTGDQKNIDKLFRDGLKGMREKAPVHAWSRLDHALDGARRRKKMVYYRLAAASVLILMAFGAGYYYATFLNKPEAVVTDESSIQQAPPTPTETFTEVTDDDQSVTITEGVEPNDVDQREKPTSEPTPQTIQPVHGQMVADADSDQPHDPMLQVPADDPTTLTLSPDPVLTAMTFRDVKQIEQQESGMNAGIIDNTGSDEAYTGSLFYYPEEYAITLPEQNKKWSLGAQFAPTYSYREISANYGANVAGNQDMVDDLNTVEDPLLSYAGGVDVGYNFSGKWSVQSGVYFSRIGQVNNDALKFIASSNALVLNSINTSTGKINVAFERVPDNVRKIVAPKDSIGIGGITDVKVIQNFDLFEVPLLIRYKFLDRKFSMNLTGGLSPAYLVGNNTYLETEERKHDVGDAGNLNSMIVNTSLGMGFEYAVTRKFSVNFEPTFKYSLNPINNSSDINYHPYYFSWFTGVRLKIN
jgi:hypothetical protein